MVDSPIPEFLVVIRKPWFLMQISINKETVQHYGMTFKKKFYLKQKQVDMLSLAFKKLNLCPVMPASGGVNPLATSHTVEHLPIIYINSWSQDKPILF